MATVLCMGGESLSSRHMVLRSAGFNILVATNEPHTDGSLPFQLLLWFLCLQSCHRAKVRPFQGFPSFW